MDNNFQAPKFQAQQQAFKSKNMRMNEAIHNKIRKTTNKQEDLGMKIV